jgi:protein MpaA
MQISPFNPLTTLEKIFFVSPANVNQAVIDKAAKEKLIASFCAEIDAAMLRFKWKERSCSSFPWKADLKTKEGRPLIYAVFGTGTNTTLVLGGVHPDEITPVPMGFRVVDYLRSHPEAYAGDTQIIVAPLVNPDGFMRDTPTRTNSNGVDLNRNFFTMDWYGKALNLWENRRKKIASHFPGYFPNSEVETLFQIELVDHYKPDKILSIHAPLGFLDYDGPGDGLPVTNSPTQKRAKQLVKAISERSKNYKVVDYNFYPGSLGNFAGNERHIPTVTLELETTNPGMVDTYWDQFLPGILQSIQYPFKPEPETDGTMSDNASPFSTKYNLPEKTI